MMHSKMTLEVLTNIQTVVRTLKEREKEFMNRLLIWKSDIPQAVCSPVAGVQCVG
jgi:hypothetical protein